MKTPLALSALLVAATFSLAGVTLGDPPAKLEVHEWGTFTVVSGSDGTQLKWYQPTLSLAELPKFVKPNYMVFGKAAPLGDLIRMETPVIYFYPDHAMPVSVDVKFLSGRITESFPFPTKMELNDYATMTGGRVTWKGELVAPDDAGAAANLPSAEGPQGAHYAHARDVPGAWFFHGAKPEMPAVGDANPPQEWEKFVFYRGAGNAYLPLLASAPDDDTLQLMQRQAGDVEPTWKGTVAFMLQVEADQARWARMPDISSPDAKHNAAPTSTARFNAAPQPIAQVKEFLGEAMEKELAAAGLTKDEAKAMIATWRDSWFQEPGTRIFALLPQAWLDTVLPLTITPTPSKVTRVFVGRFELFTPAQEQTLLSLLAPLEKVQEASAKRFARLQLGRFGNAAVERTKDLLTRHATERFYELQQASVLHPATSAQ